jgi:hypothetical protein
MKYFKSQILQIILMFPLACYSQIITQPNFAMKSHETLEILKIVTTPNNTLIYMSVENRRDGGYFCADKNIFILYPDGTRSKLIKAEGIPACPENYKFKAIGEKLGFTLLFPPLKPSTEWIDLIEDCSDNCFSFYGVTLDNDLNKSLDEAFAAASTGKPEEYIMLFRKILESVDSKDLGIEGSLYINIISAAYDAGDKVEAAVWYKRLLSSHAPRLSQYVRFLNAKGIKF